MTRMRRLKVDQEVIMAATGHATDILFRRYRGIDESDLRAIIDAKEQAGTEELSGAKDPKNELRSGN